MVDVWTEDTVLGIQHRIHLPLAQRPALLWPEHRLIVFLITPHGGHFQKVPRASEDIQSTGIIGKELPGKMGNDGAGFPQFKAGMQETRHLAQLRVENTALLYLLDHNGPCRCFLSHVSPAADQENRQYEAHGKDCDDDFVNLIPLILL